VTARLIQPDFLLAFDCKRSACRRTCCRDWEVVLTRQEFEARTSPELDPLARALAAKTLIPNPNAQGDQDHALAALRPDGFCSLLTEDHLCSWKNLRAEGLCAACNDFPNTSISFLEDEYLFPSLSCEAIVELLLNKADPIRLAGEAIAQKQDRHLATIENAHFAKRPLLELYPKLIDWGLAILEDRRFPLDSRMTLLANAMSLIDWMERQGRVAEVPDAMEKFLAPESLHGVLKKFAQHSFGPRAVLTVCGNALLRLAQHSAYGTPARRALDGLGFEEVVTGEDGEERVALKLADSEKYLNRKEKLHDLLREKETLLEHVMVCQYLRSMMPVAAGGVWENFEFFNVCYALVKGILVGSFDATPDDAELVEAIVVIHRMFVHNYDAYHETVEFLKTMGHADLLSMVALARG
jgi:hypothetical protein